MNLTLLTSAISAALAGAAGFAVAWNIQSKIILDNSLGYANERISQQRAARATSERFAQQVITAQNAAAARAVTLRRDADSAASSGNGLRIASTTAVRASTGDLDACTASLDAHSVVLDDLSRIAEGLAAEADSWASQAVALQEGWPQ